MTGALLLVPDARVLVIAVALDLVFGDPPNALHPVAWLGRLVNTLVRRIPAQGARAQFLAGVALVAAALAASLLASVLMGTLLHGSDLVPRPAALLIEAAFLKTTFAIRGLGVAGRQVAERLTAKDGVGARRALGSLCSRDASPLNESQVAAAAVESLSENVSDSVIAPLLFYVLLGLPGAVLYRAANTLDAMVGYHGRFEYLGKAAARLDDALNWVPARATAALLLLAGHWRGAQLRNGWRVFWRDGAATESPNAGRPMAAMAGLLGIVLEKPGHYRLGAEGGLAQESHIGKAWLISRDAALLGCTLAVAIASAIGWSGASGLSR